MSDLNYFSFLFPLAKLFGLFPVSLKNGMLKVNLKSTICGKTWSLFVFFYHIICCQSLYICTMVSEDIIQNIPAAVPLEKKVMRYVPIVSYLQNYLLYIIWFLSIPKIIRCWNYIQEYDKTYPSVSKRVNLYKDSQFLILIVNCLIVYTLKCFALTFTFAKWNFFELEETCLEYFNTSCTIGENVNNRSQWLALIFESEKLRNYAMALHIFFVQFATIFLFLFTYFLSRSVALRVQDISNQIILAQTMFRGKSLLWQLKGKANPNSKLLDENDSGSIILQSEVHRKLILLSEIFELLSKASTDFIFLFVTGTFIFVSVLSFYCLMAVRLGLSDFLSWCAVFILTLKYLLMLTLFAFGDDLNSEVDKMRKLIMQIYSDTWLSTKCLASSLDFQLTGKGYFSLHRQTFASIFSAIVAYIVVLKQYQISEDAN